MIDRPRRPKLHEYKPLRIAGCGRKETGSTWVCRDSTRNCAFISMYLPCTSVCGCLSASPWSETRTSCHWLDLQVLTQAESVPRSYCGHCSQSFHLQNTLAVLQWIEIVEDASSHCLKHHLPRHLTHHSADRGNHCALCSLVVVDCMLASSRECHATVDVDVVFRITEEPADPR